MDCPNCGRAVPDDVATCPHCAAAIAREDAPGELPDLVTVLETGDAALLAVAESQLEAEGIARYPMGEGVQEFIGLGRAGLGENLVTGRVRLQVAPADYEAAKALLAARGEFPDLPIGD
jgi:RNA polymerase subunit RPABC4/transcription elongation factor Spt4